jgi:hypothetical protein
MRVVRPKELVGAINNMQVHCYNNSVRKRVKVVTPSVDESKPQSEVSDMATIKTILASLVLVTAAAGLPATSYGRQIAGSSDLQCDGDKKPKSAVPQCDGDKKPKSAVPQCDGDKKPKSAVPQCDGDKKPDQPKS